MPFAYVWCVLLPGVGLRITFFTFTSLGTFFGVLGSDFLKRSRKIAKSGYWLRYVCPSAGGKLGFYWTDSHEIWYMTIFLKICRAFGLH